MNELAKLGREVSEIMKNNGDILGFRYCGMDKQVEVQLWDICFKEHAEGHEITELSRDSTEFEVELSFTIEGVKFFTVLTNEEYEQDFAEWLHPPITDDEFITTPMTSEQKLKDVGMSMHKDFI